MRRLLLFVLLLAFGCQKSSVPPVAQIQPTEANVGSSESPRRKAPRTKRVPLAQRPDRSMVPLPPPPAPPPKAKPTLGKDEAVAAVHLFLTTLGATTAATYNSKESQENRPQNVGGGYGNVQFTAVGEPKEYGQVAETKKLGWVVPISFTANNPRLKCRIRATNHLFLVSRFQDNERPRVIFHGSSEQVAKARFGEEWYILNRPPRPQTETSP